MKLLFVICVFCFSEAFAQTINLEKKQIDSLKRQLPLASDHEKIAILQDLIINLWLNHPDSAMSYSKQAMSLTEKTDNVRDRAIAVRLYGAVYYYLGSYDSAIKYGHRAYELSQSVNDYSLMSSSLNNIGLASYFLGSYPSALDYLLRALKIKYQTNQFYGLGNTLNNIGLVYDKLKSYDTARGYFSKAITYAESRKDNNIILYSFNNIAYTYFEEKDYPKAKSYYERALAVAQKVDNLNWHGDANIGLGEVYLTTGELHDAMVLLRRALTLKIQIGEKNGVSEVYYFLSKIKAKENQLDSAFVYLKLSQALTYQTGSREQRQDNLALFKDLYMQKKKYDSALFFQSKYLELRDSLFNETMARNLGDIQMKIKEEESQQQLAKKDVQIQQKTTLTYLLIAGILATVIFLFVTYRFYKVQKRLSIDLEKKNLEITNQKEEIHLQKEALTLGNQELEKAQEKINQQNLKLSAMNEHLLSTVDIRTKELEQANQEIRMVSLELDNFIYKSSHDIKGPLARLLGICHVALLDVKDETSRRYFQMLNQTSQQLNDIFNKLKIVSDINTKNVDHVPVDLKSIFQNVQQSLKTMAGFEGIRISSEIAVTADYDSDPYLLEIIFRNMLENAIRFQRKAESADKFIKVKVRKNNSNLVLNFIDNGIGIKQADADDIFKMFSQAALEHQTVGLGLYIVKQCVSKLNGSINLVRNNQKNTEFEIVLS
jgi:signal transduction histidine kinase